MKKLVQGDIVYTDLYPTVGHEQSGIRPVLILGNASCDKFSGMSIICPITTNTREYPTKVEILGNKIKGFVLCDQIRALDFSEREYTYIETIDEDTLWNVVDTVEGLINIL
ncbi:MAG: type II toxin-antitoxin system PemK/MazF family toxin [Ruminococcus sp.]|nr:type II toxin-antitoxin system PemK/MazF family toxin [Ruminococcus sp.]